MTASSLAIDFVSSRWTMADTPGVHGPVLRVAIDRLRELDAMPAQRLDARARADVVEGDLDGPPRAASTAATIAATDAVNAINAVAYVTHRSRTIGIHAS